MAFIYLYQARIKHPIFLSNIFTPSCFLLSSFFFFSFRGHVLARSARDRYFSLFFSFSSRNRVPSILHRFLVLRPDVKL
ncbi:putative replication initiator protein [Niminivirus]|uniref:putative replication initiator protein n=1 Tax=Niminivirus TaxID=1229325 RepID=UPI00027EDBCB|nr:putative replication initiator protein [Niminivirus]AFR11832.2 putative replication initiator protein [Niminivirus]